MNKKAGGKAAVASIVEEATALLSLINNGFEQDARRLLHAIVRQERRLYWPICHCPAWSSASIKIVRLGFIFSKCGIHSVISRPSRCDLPMPAAANFASS